MILFSQGQAPAGKATTQLLAFLLGVSVTAGLSYAQQTVSYSYHANGKIETIDGPRTDVSDITTYQYDDSANIASVTNALGHITQYASYNDRGQPLQVIDANGVTTDYTYTPSGFLKSSTLRHPNDPGKDRLTHYSYDHLGQLVSTTLPNGGALEYEYDGARRLSAIEDISGNRIEYTHDAAGNREVEVIRDSNGAITRTHSRVFDELNRVMNVIGAANQTHHFEYDANGNATTDTNPRTFVTSHEYDALNRLVKSIDPLLGETDFSYNTHNALTSVTDARGLTTTYHYDIFNNLTNRSSPDTGTTGFSYDSANNRTSMTDARGIVTSYSYDALNRLNAVTYPGNSAENVSYHYDDTSNGNYGVGRLTGITDDSGQIHYRYDHAGNLVAKTYTIASISYTQGFTYDDSGELATVSYPSGRLVHYSRDTNGRVSGITTQANQGTVMETVVSDLNYLPFGPIKSMTFGNGIEQTTLYDQDYRITNIAFNGQNPIVDYALAYDSNSNIDSVSRGEIEYDQQFVYDELDRIDSASGYYGSIDYQYDAVGNRLIRMLNQGSDVTTENYQYSPVSHRLEHINIDYNGAGRSRNFAYDAAGNTIQDEVTTAQTDIQYNHANRPVSASKSGQTLAYVHNSLGQRTQKISASVDEHYHYNESGQLIAITNGSGQVLQEIIYLDATPVAVLYGEAASGMGLYLVHSNHLDTPQILTNNAQQIVWQVESQTPFGEVIVNQDPDNDGEVVVFNLRFPGQYYDDETGTNYNYYRTYDPGLGRYIQSDPIGLAGGINTYAYVGGNPVVRYDPLGLIQSCRQKYPERYTDAVDRAIHEETVSQLSTVGTMLGIVVAGHALAKDGQPPLQPSKRTPLGRGVGRVGGPVGLLGLLAGGTALVMDQFPPEIDDDNDNDGHPDECDPDDDNDGIPDSEEEDGRQYMPDTPVPNWINCREW